mgnify:CR=1 FL=1
MKHNKTYSFGRNNLFVNQSLVSSRGKGVSNKISDPFREMVGKYYVAQPDGTVLYQGRGREDLSPVQVLTKPDGTSVLQFKFTTTTQDDEETQRRMVSLAELMDMKSVFYDYAFQFQKPINYNLAKDMNKAGRVEYINATTNYNFMASTYEKFMQNNPTISENVLPSFYALYAQGTYGQNNVGALNSLNGNFRSKKRSMKKFLSAFNSAEDFVKDSFVQYFNDFGQSANNLVKRKNGPKTLGALSTAYKTFTFSNDALPVFTTEASKGELFPFYNKIEFSTDSKSVLADLLWELQIGDEIVSQVIRDRPGIMNLATSAQGYLRSRIKSMPPIEKYAFGATKLNVWDIPRWVQEKLFATAGLPGPLIGTTRSPMTPNNVTTSELSTKAILAAKINKISQNKYRTLKELFNGKLAYSEVVFYKIQKFSEDNLKKPISTYYIPNSSKMRECTFVDTQVKYGSKYAYTISSFVLVVGSAYSYNTFNQIDDVTVNIGVGTTPKMKLFQIPTATIRNMLVLDKPPIPPESLIVSFKNIGNKLMINMNGSTGDRDMIPIALEATDKAKFNRQRIAQRTTGNKLRFKSDDTPGSFEIFRTTKRPSSYEDFEGTKIRVLSTGGLATSAAMKDDITTDVKYYYIFRSVDIHGNISNPSPVYEVEMKSSAGPPYLLLNTIDFKEEEMKNKKPLKSMRRYVQIIPTTPQGLLNVEQSNLISAKTVKGVRSVVLGVAEEKLWGKKFRFRFTSKKTGRKIDLDVNFRAEHQLKQS